MRTPIEVELFQTVHAIARLVGDDAFDEIVASIGNKEDPASIEKKIEHLSKTRKWGDLSSIIAKHKGRILDLAIATAIKVTDHYIRSGSSDG